MRYHPLHRVYSELTKHDTPTMMLVYALPHQEIIALHNRAKRISHYSFDSPSSFPPHIPLAQGVYVDRSLLQKLDRVNLPSLELRLGTKMTLRGQDLVLNVESSPKLLSLQKRIVSLSDDALLSSSSKNWHAELYLGVPKKNVPLEVYDIFFDGLLEKNCALDSLVVAENIRGRWNEAAKYVFS